MTAKELKNALLQEAVQGKLVPQIASEGNARDLLEEIRKEKAKLVKEGKLKKEKPLPELTEEEIPFDIPDNWCWCRLGDITSLITDGKHGGGILENNSGFFFLSAKDIQNGKLIYTNADQITKDDFITTHKRTNLEPGDICIVNTGGTIGKLAIAPDDEKTNRTTFQKSVAIVKPFKNFVSNLYISNYFQFDLNNLVKISGGSAIHNLLLSDMKNELLPLPPLAEQKRIVAAIEKIMPLIEEYGKKETELKAFNEQIGTLTKKAILQEAVQGKLVPQIAAEGNAKDLLEEIKKEKAKLIREGKSKKEKPLAEITEDEIPFDIPENWCWCRLGYICQLIDGEKVQNVNLPLLDAKYLRGKKQAEFLSVGKLAQINDLLILVDGENSGEVFINKENGIMGSTFKKLIINKKLYLPYVLAFISMNKDLLRNSKKGAAIPHLNKDIFFGLLLPLPPLEEQKRIVAAIEKMLSLCEKLGE